MAPEGEPALVPHQLDAGTKALAHSLFSSALLRGTFTLRSGVVSDRYFDKYRMSCDPELLRQVATELVERARRVEPDARCIVAPELGAVPIATAMSLLWGIPTAFVRSAGKAYGTAQRIEGAPPSDARSVLVEDVVTSGGAALEALAVAREAGADIRHTLCVLDRDGGGREALHAAGAPLTTLLTAGDLDAAFAAGLGVDA